MPGTFVFVRLWPGFSLTFPAEQFDGLEDHEIAPVLFQYAKDWVPRRAEEYARKAGLDEGSKLLRLPKGKPDDIRLAKAHARAAGMIAARAAHMRAKRVEEDRFHDVALFRRVAELEGWGSGDSMATNRADFERNLRRHPIARFEDKVAASAAAAALQRRFHEIADGPESRLQAATNHCNPRFFIVPETKLSQEAARAATATLNRLDDPPSRTTTIVERLLRPLVPEIRGVLAAASPTDKCSQSGTRNDGPEPPHWLQWKKKRYRIGTGRSKLSWRLLNHFWNRDSAAYEDLQGPDKPWLDPVGDSSVATAVNRFNTHLPTGFPWKLTTKDRFVTKQSRENPAR